MINTNSNSTNSKPNNINPTENKMTNEINNQMHDLKTDMNNSSLGKEVHNFKESKKEELENFGDRFSTLVDKIKKATEEEMPALKQSLMDLMETKEAYRIGAEPIKKTLSAIKCRAKDEMDHAREAGDAYIAYNPWKSVALAGVAGLFIGAALSSRETH